MTSAVLKITCPDRKGLIAGISNFIFENNGNIISLDEYVDPTTNTFFLRLEWDLKGFKISRKELPARLARFADGCEVFFSDEQPRVAIFVSKYDHCLYDLLLRHKSGELKCTISVIVSNHQDLKYIAETFNIPFVYIPVTDGKKSAAENKQLEVLTKYKIDVVILARYMQVLSKQFIERYKNKIINVHHSFLPAFKGSKPYHQAYERGVKIIGATSHFVNENLDQGPIIQQDVQNISHKDTIDDLIAKGRDLERKVLASAIQLYLNHRLFICGNRTIIL